MWSALLSLPVSSPEFFLLHIFFPIFLHTHLLVKSLITISFLLVFWVGCYNMHTQFTVYIKGSCLNTSKNCALHNLHTFKRAEEKTRQ